MSTLDEKLAHHRETGGPARATLVQLSKRWGSPPELNAKKPPTLVLVTTMAHIETWHMVGRPDGGATVYELHEMRALP